MNKKMPKWFPFLIIPLGGILMSALVYVSYFGVYLLAEYVFKLNPDQHMGTLRSTTMEAFVFLYLMIFVFVKGHELLKATLLTGPMVMMLVTLMFQRTQSSLRMILILTLIPLIFAGIFKWLKKPWFYFYALLFSVLMAIWYGWPQ